MRSQGNNPVLPDSLTAELALEVADLRLAVECQPTWKITKALQDVKRELWRLDGADEPFCDVLDLIEARVGDLPRHSRGRCWAGCLVVCVESMLEYVD